MCPIVCLPSHLHTFVTPFGTAENLEKNPENLKMFGIFGTVLEAEQVHLLLV